MIEFNYSTSDSEVILRFEATVEGKKIKFEISCIFDYKYDDIMN